MHQGIFLGDEKAINRVYPEAVRAALAKICALKETVYPKAAVLDAPERFADTAYIFSTWGMPAFTEREIETCFPKLRAVFYAAGTVQAFARPFLARGVQVFSAWAANAVPVAEYTAAQIVLANKGFYQNQRLYGRGEPARAAAAQQGAEVDGAIEAALTGRTQWRPAPGVHALLSALGGKHRLGIVSNNRARIRRTLEEAELLPYFSAVTISEEAGVEKPDPRILAMTCEALGVAPAESLYVGDHPFDVLCAERAGMDCAWVDIGLFEPEDLPAQPRWTLRALAELAAVTAL